jgi:hypothetical protein
VSTRIKCGAGLSGACTETRQSATQACPSLRVLVIEALIAAVIFFLDGHGGVAANAG